MNTTPCQYCKSDIAYEPIPDFPALKPNVCGLCGIDIDRMMRGVMGHRRFDAWKRLCPAIYQDSDPARLRKAPRILEWAYGPKGLLVHGPTRRGKTRLVWLLIKRLMLEGQKSVAALTSGEFARQCAAAHFAGADSACQWFDSLTRPDVLFIDDLGKFKLTERVESELFEIVDHRISHGKPVLFTTNFVGADLLSRMSPDRGAPFMARIHEFCEVVSL